MKTILTFGLLAVVAVVASVVDAASSTPEQGTLVRFHPISREEYDSVLRLTKEKPVLSQGRLISNGFQSLQELRTSIGNDITSGWHRLLNIVRFTPTSTKTSSDKIEDYPLCVIKTSDYEPITDEGGQRANNGRQEGEAGEDFETVQATAIDFNRIEHLIPIDDGEDGEVIEDEHGNKRRRPVINCIVVVKSKNDPEDKPTKRPQKHDKNPSTPDHPYPPTSPYSAYAPYASYGLNAYAPYPYTYTYPYIYTPAATPAPPSEARKSTNRKSQLRQSSRPADRDYIQEYYQQVLSNYYQQLQSPQADRYPEASYPATYGFNYYPTPDRGHVNPVYSNEAMSEEDAYNGAEDRNGWESGEEEMDYENEDDIKGLKLRNHQ